MSHGLRVQVCAMRCDTRRVARPVWMAIGRRRRRSRHRRRRRRRRRQLIRTDRAH